MRESAEFFETLEHDNPQRPRFRIKPSGYENLEISFNGQVMCIPMTEVLLFARRWEADFKLKDEAARRKGDLCLFPYNLMNARMNDPDVGNLRWWPED